MAIKIRNFDIDYEYETAEINFRFTDREQMKLMITQIERLVEKENTKDAE